MCKNKKALQAGLVLQGFLVPTRPLPADGQIVRRFPGFQGRFHTDPRRLFRALLLFGERGDGFGVFPRLGQKGRHVLDALKLLQCGLMLAETVLALDGLFRNVRQALAHGLVIHALFLAVFRNPHRRAVLYGKPALPVFFPRHAAPPFRLLPVLLFKPSPGGGFFEGMEASASMPEGKCSVSRRLTDEVKPRCHRQRG
jgi:hypothetical protein